MFSFTEKFMSSDKNVEFARSAMMGPNAMRVSEELAYYLDIKPGMRVLDLGCGCGLSTLLLAEKYGATVFAADLWISPTENYEHFRSLGIDDKAVPVYVDAAKGLPFANGYFDVLFSVDAYHYFGDSADMLPSLIPFVKRGGYIAVAVPGLKYEFGKDVPAEMRPFWNGEMEGRCTRWAKACGRAQRALNWQTPGRWTAALRHGKNGWTAAIPSPRGTLI